MVSERNYYLKMYQKFKKYFPYLTKSVVIIYIAFFLYFFVEESLGIIVPLFFEERKISIVLYGTLLSFTKIARAVVVIPISVQSTKKKMLCLKITFILDMLAFIMLINTKSIITIFVGFSCLFITTSILNVVLNPILGFSADKEHIGIVFGIRDAFLYAGCFLGLLIIGIMKTISNSTKIIWLLYCFIFGLVFFSICSLEKSFSDIDKSESEEESIVQNEKIKMKGISKELSFYLVILFLLGVGGACTNFLPLVASNIGIKESGIFYIFSTSTFISSILAISGGIVLDKFNKKFLFQTDIVLFIIILIMYIIGNKWLLTVAILISGISTTFDNASNIYVFTNYSEEEVSRFWGLIGSINLISYSIGTFFCGIFYEKDYRLLFLFGIILNVMALIMSAKLKNIEKKNRMKIFNGTRRM